MHFWCCLCLCELSNPLPLYQVWRGCLACLDRKETKEWSATRGCRDPWAGKVGHTASAWTWKLTACVIVEVKLVICVWLLTPQLAGDCMNSQLWCDYVIICLAQKCSKLLTVKWTFRKLISNFVTFLTDATNIVRFWVVFWRNDDRVGGLHM